MSIGSSFMNGASPGKSSGRLHAATSATIRVGVHTHAGALFFTRNFRSSSDEPNYPDRSLGSRTRTVAPVAPDSSTADYTDFNLCALLGPIANQAATP